MKPQHELMTAIYRHVLTVGARSIQIGYQSTYAAVDRAAQPNQSVPAPLRVQAAQSGGGGLRPPRVRWLSTARQTVVQVSVVEARRQVPLANQKDGPLAHLYGRVIFVGEDLAQHQLQSTSLSA